MEIRELHPWQVSPSEAAAIQRRLRGDLDLTDHVTLDSLRLVAGVDNAYVRVGRQTIAHAAAVVVRLPTLDVVETVTAAREVDFPYVPGLLSFREAPAILDALRRLTADPDALIFDGQGYAHPRRLGLASHLGLLLSRPTVGCAKSRLVGRATEPGDRLGDRSPLVDRGEVVGAVVRTRPSHAPLFVSPGNRVTVDTAVAIVLACCRNGEFLPEPTRLAHHLVTAHADQHRQRIRASAAPGEPAD